MPQAKVNRKDECKSRHKPSDIKGNDFEFGLEREKHSGAIQDCLCSYRWGEVTARIRQVGVLTNTECWPLLSRPSSPPNSTHPLSLD